MEWTLPAETTRHTLVVPTATTKCFFMLTDPPCLRIAGPTIAPTRPCFRGAGRMVGISFRPAGFARFSRVAVKELVDTYGDDEGVVLGGRVDALQERLDQASNDATVVARLDTYLLRRLEVTRERDAERVVRACLQQVQASARPPRVADLTRAMQTHERTLQRAFKHAVGVSPSFALRLERLHRSLRLLSRGERRLARVAVDGGYYDQAHFTNEIRGLTGVTPTGLSAWLASVGSIQEGSTTAS